MNLTDDQKQKMWDEITKAINSRDELLPSERTAKMIASDLKCTEDKARKYLNRLEKAGVIGSRIIIAHGARTKVYFCVESCSMEELMTKLKG